MRKLGKFFEEEGMKMWVIFEVREDLEECNVIEGIKIWLNYILKFELFWIKYGEIFCREKIFCEKSE